MKLFKSILQVGSILSLAVFFAACGANTNQEAQNTSTATDSIASRNEEIQKNELPKQFQRPSYMIGDEIKDNADIPDLEGDSSLKVGATIRSTSGPMPLRDIMKWLAESKKMNVSWASDVDNSVLVDVDISANDDFYNAIDNLLRQVDYFHEMEGNTIVVKYKETRQYQLGMPYIKQQYDTGAGGNILGGNDDKSDSIDGTISLTSKGNEYDFWKQIDANLEKILKVWKTTDSDNVLDGEGGASAAASSKDDYLAEITKNCKAKWPNDFRQVEYCVKQETEAYKRLSGDKSTDDGATRRVSKDENVYTIDQSIGLITVTAPRPLLEKIDDYINNLKKHIYRQVNIEAKIIEVQLTEASSLGINWTELLDSFSIATDITFGSSGQVWPYIFSGSSSQNTYDSDGNYTRTYDPGRFVSSVNMSASTFNIFLSALQTQGQTSVLSTPKISLLNGQVAMLTVGRNVTYIDTIESDIDTDNGIITYTVETDDILSGIGMALTATIIDDDEVIMNLTPVTSELELNSNNEIDYEDVGDYGGKVGLPVVNVREMSTTVKVKNGETLVIGGLIDETKDDTGEFLPILGDIPVVKYLFGHEDKSKTKRELIILLKPVIL